MDIDMYFYKKSYAYSRYKDKVDDRKSPSHGMQAAVSFADNEMYEEDIQCLASDDFDGYKAVLGKEEKAVSRIISINSKKGNLGTEVRLSKYQQSTSNRKQF
ncbi:hypothetical protein DPMN_080816 [Dreissena polymorpha]|uniref:Uncharacterized protein n=1 Tax=Dreissena polymorpha TaxID=45954 RepID=A0A9D4BS18_DREPO|nr:hypothetical protein DPMN_080816 [Dreissena polymorpha]